MLKKGDEWHTMEERRGRRTKGHEKLARERIERLFNLAEEIVVTDLEVLTAMKTAVLDGWYMPMTLGLNLEKRLIGNIKPNN